MNAESFKWRTQGIMKMRIPSGSFCQCFKCTILLFSSSTALEYTKKNGPELSPKLDFSTADSVLSLLTDLVANDLPFG